MTTTRKDLHQTVTDQIVAQIEAGTETFEMPWHCGNGAIARPTNVLTGNAYRGINVLSLWGAAHHNGFPHGLWGTYRQWQERGAQVRKGQKSSIIVFYKQIDIERTDPDSGETEEDTLHFARSSRVFNVAQVDGYEMPGEDLPGDTITPVENAERFVNATKAIVDTGGTRAFYCPSNDTITMPDRERFTGTQSCSVTEGWYGVLLHELTHWSGAKHRLDRDLHTRFGSDGYAMEELVAEAGAAFLCADLGITPEPRKDHAAYLATWLEVLKNDKKAIFTAAAQAEKAVAWLMTHRCEKRAA